MYQFNFDFINSLFDTVPQEMEDYERIFGNRNKEIDRSGVIEKFSPDQKQYINLIKQKAEDAEFEEI